MFGPFGPNILSFVWISTLLSFYVEGYFSLIFLSNRLQTLAQWSLGFREVCYDFSKSYVMFFWIFVRIFWITLWINVGTLMYL